MTNCALCSHQADWASAHNTWRPTCTVHTNSRAALNLRNLTFSLSRILTQPTTRHLLGVDIRPLIDELTS